MVGFVPAPFMQFYKTMDLAGNMFVLNRFQRDKFEYQEWPNHENYILACCKFKILFNEQTKLVRLSNHVPRGLCVYPLVPSIQNLTQDMISLKRITSTYQTFRYIHFDNTLSKFYNIILTIVIYLL